MSSTADWLDEAVEKVADGFGWLRDLVLGEFAEERPLSVVIADMLLSLVPGVVIVLSARDLAAVCLRLGKRYAADVSQATPQPPEWQEWVLLVACLMTLIAPIIGAVAGAVGTPVGSVAGALVGQEAAAFLRGLCLLLIRESQVILQTVVAFLGKFTRGSVEFWLHQVRFASYEKDLLAYLNLFLTKVLAATAKLRSYLGNWPFNQAASHLLVRLQAMEAQFYAVQVHAVREIPHALMQLDARLAKVLEQASDLPAQVAQAGVHAQKPVPMAMSGGRVTSGIGMRPRYLERPEGVLGPPVPTSPTVAAQGANVHVFDHATATRAQKGIYGEVVSDQYMLGKGHENLLSAARGPRSLEMKPTGRGLDGVYRNAHPPPPFIITETKYRTGGVFSPGSLPVTKGSEGYPSARQMSDAWIGPRLQSALGRKEGDAIREAGYERWLIVVNENGVVSSVTKLDGNARAIVDTVR
ncbi:hypothetical protein [Pseudomonas putida]|uniref:hypothetical protein n=1 Tax=Pseudomonas putida TaxID=303 RepID=UPI0039063D5B